MRKVPWFWGTICVWMAVAAVYGLISQAIDHFSVPARAEHLTTADQVDRTHKSSQMTFNERAGAIFDAPASIDATGDLKGGALGEAKTVRALLFLKGQDRSNSQQHRASPPY